MTPGGVENTRRPQNPLYGPEIVSLALLEVILAQDSSYKPRDRDVPVLI